VIRRRARLAAITTTIATLGLAACGGQHAPSTGAGPVPTQTETPAALAVITGDRNSPLAVLTPTLTAMIRRAVSRNAGLALIDAGGRPRLFSVTLGGHLANSDAQNAADQQQLSQAAAALDRVTPVTAQSDPWTAFAEAVGWLRGQGGGTLVVENSGLGTTGFLDYRQPGLLAAEPKNLVTFAQRTHELPNASGINVILVGIGWTATPQPGLTGPERTNLVAQWQALTAASGATVTVDPTPLTGPGPAGAPPVTPIPVTGVSWQPPAGMCGQAFNSNSVHFIVGTAQLIDPAAALAALHNVVATLKANHQIATVTGTTSSEGGQSLNVPLSRSRAATIAALLRQMGLPASQIGPVVGDGCHFNGYIPDTAPDGTLLPGPAAENRQTIISWPCSPGTKATSG